MSMVGVMSCSVLVMMVTLAGLHTTHAKVNYRCDYGNVRSVTDKTGGQLYFCATEMTPPFMQLGQYLVARDATGACYECLCELRGNIGMACCETRCR